MAFVFFLTLALGCLYFVLIHTAMQGAWGVVVRRVAENAAGTLPLFALLFLPLALGLEHLYPWSRPEAATDALLRWKRPYLNEAFFLLRAALYFVVWSAIALWFLRQSRRQDAAPDPGVAARLVRWSGPLLIPLGPDPHLRRLRLADVARAPLVLDDLRRLLLLGVSGRGLRLPRRSRRCPCAARGPSRAPSAPSTCTTSGKLLFAFTAFWAYIGFSQYFLIWYGNIPEETVLFRHRLEGGWAGATLLARGRALRGALLLPAAAGDQAQRRWRSSVAAAWLLLMHLRGRLLAGDPVDSPRGARRPPGSWTLAALVAVGGGFLAAFGWLTRAAPRWCRWATRGSRNRLAFENV